MQPQKATRGPLLVLTLGFGCLLLGCGGEDRDATVIETTAVAPAAIAADPAAAIPGRPLAAVEVGDGRSSLDNENTSVTIRSGASHPDAGDSWEATFSDLFGHLRVEDDQLTALLLEFDAASLQTPDAQLKQDLSSTELLNTAEFPTARFEMTSVEDSTQAAETQATEPSQQPGQVIHVTGNLTLAGHTQEITAPAVVQVKDGRVAVSVSMQLDRDAFGMAPYQEDVQNTFQIAIEIGNQEDLE